MAVYIDAVMYEFAEHRDQLSSNGSKAFEASKPNTGALMRAAPEAYANTGFAELKAGCRGLCGRS
jgi:hypothetical protein